MPRQAQPVSFYRRTTALAGEIFDHWSRDNAPRLAASLAYYTILSSAPLLVVSIALASFFFGDKAVKGQLAWEIQTLVGGQAARAIQTILSNAHQPSSGILATVLSIAILIVGASSVVVELHSALNLIWGVPDPSDSAGSMLANAIAFVKQRLYSSVLLLGAGCLLLVSLIASVSLAAISNFFRPLLPLPDWILHLATFGASFLIVMLVFGAIYKFLPDVHLTWRDVLMGAAVTALLFAVGKQLLAVYLSHVGFQSTYGAAWTLVIFLVWIYYSAQLFFLGAEFTKVYARRYGSHHNRPPAPGVR